MYKQATWPIDNREFYQIFYHGLTTNPVMRFSSFCFCVMQIHLSFPCYLRFQGQVSWGFSREGLYSKSCFLSKCVPGVSGSLYPLAIDWKQVLMLKELVSLSPLCSFWLGLEASLNT